MRELLRVLWLCIEINQKRSSTQWAAHLVKENLKLYIYLQNLLKEQPEEYQQMRAFRKEMDDIGVIVRKTIAQYIDIDQHPEQQEILKEKLDGIGEVLLRRIKSEERLLYPLYQGE